jgi:hypothetical protein
MCSSTLSLSSELDGKGWSTPRPGRFTRGKDPLPIVKMAGEGGGPEPVWTGAENLVPTGIWSPDRPTRSESLHRLSCPGPHYYYCYYYHHHYHHHRYLLTQGIYTYIPEKNHVPREHRVAAILVLLFMVLISLVPALTPLYLYFSTFRSMCAVPSMAVFCSSLTS